MERKWSFRCGAVAVLAGSALLLTACGQTGSAPVSKASGPPGFVVYDNTFYTDVNLEQYGAVKSNVVYEGPVAALAGQNPKDFQGDRRVELSLPPQGSYEKLIQQHLSNPGPVVLDFETLYLEGSAEVAQRHFQKLSTLLAWAHAAAPGKVIGCYGLLGHTAEKYYPLARQLASAEDAFFPTLYTHDTDHGTWQTTLAAAAAQAKAIDPSKPVYAFLWPQYHQGTPLSGTFLSAADWAFELQTARTYTNGVVIWSPATLSTDKGWVTATQQFLAAARHS